MQALKTNDFVYLHVEASDEAGHEGDVDLKIKTIEYLNKRAIKPIFETLQTSDEPVGDQLLYPDHPLSVQFGRILNEPIPFIIYKPGQTPDAVQRYDEYAAKEDITES